MSAVSYYQSGDSRASSVQKLFTRIAPHYDFVNDLQSLGLHRLWKRKLVRTLQIPSQAKVLDLASGSGDLIFRIKKSHPNTQVVGGDYTFSMLKVARRRSSEAGLEPRWIQLDGLQLPFSNQHFDVVTMAYGLRNMRDPLKCLQEISRTLKPGGKLAILDFGKPRNVLIRETYYFFLRTIQPALGWLFFRDAESYRYIYESLQKYPAQEGITKLLKEAGFEKIECIDLFFGMMSLHFACKK